MVFDGDLSFDHITKLHLCVSDFGSFVFPDPWNGYDEFISRCTKLTHLTDFSTLPNLRRLTYVVVPVEAQKNLIVKQCQLLREFKCDKELVKEEFDKLATLVHLTKLSVRTSESSFGVNTNLTSLSLFAKTLDSQTVIDILNIQNLKELYLKYGG